MSFLFRTPAHATRLALALLFAFGLTSRSASAASGDILARGQGVQVTQAELDEAFINLRGTLAAQGRNLPEEQRARIERQLVEKLVLTKLLLGKANDADRAKAREKVAKLIAEEKAKARTEARFNAQIRAAGLSPEVFQSQLLERAICEEVLDRELRPQLGITPESARTFYDRNATEFRQPERLRLLQVVFTLRNASGGDLTEAEKIEKKNLAGELVKRARRGEDFAALARQYSDDPPGRERGGEYIFPLGRMVPEFELAVTALQTNQISDVIVTPFSYHVVKLLERLPGQQIDFESVRTYITTRLEIEATQEKLPAFQQKLFEAAKVEFMMPK